MRRLLTWILGILWISPAFGAIAFDATNSDSGVVTVAAKTVTFHQTVGSLTNGIIIIGCGEYKGGQGVTTLTIGGVPATGRIRYDNDGTHAATSELWYQLAPASGVQAIAVTMNQSSTFSCWSISFSGVNQTSPIGAQGGNVVSGTTTSNPGSLTTVNANSVLVTALTAGNTIVAGSGQTIPASGSPQLQAASAYMAMAYKAVATPGVTANTFTYASTTSASQMSMVEIVADTVSPAPVLTSISPNAGGQGAAPAVTLTGTGFTGSPTIAISGTGVTAGSIVVVNSTTVTAVFTITAGAAGTARSVTITTSNGTSNAVTFSVQSVLVSNANCPIQANGSLPTACIPTAIVNRAYGWTMTATGGATPYTWSCPVKPSWMFCSSGGVITGTPTSAAASTNVQITVTDNNSNTNTVTIPLLTEYAIGQGCTTAHMMDKDCDGYGLGASAGQDADDLDATVNTTASFAAKYGAGFAGFQSWFTTTRGYTSARWLFIDPVNGTASCALGQSPDTSTNNYTHPCATWFQAYAISQTGDAFVFRYGYNAYNAPMQPYRGGNSTNQMAFISYPGEFAVIDHPTTPSQNGVDFGGYCTGGNIVIDGLHIWNSISGPTAANPSAFGIDEYGFCNPPNWIIRNNDISGYERAILVNDGQNPLLMEYNYIHDNYTNGSGEGHDIYIGADPVSNTPMVATVKGNIFGPSNWTNAHLSGRCNGCLMDGNIFYSANTKPGQNFSGNLGMQQSWFNSTFQNNVIFISSAFGIAVNTYRDGAPNPTNLPAGMFNNTFRNNTVYVDGQTILGSGGTTPQIYEASNTSGSVPIDNGHNFFYNNIFYFNAPAQSAPMLAYCKSQLTGISGSVNTAGTSVSLITSGNFPNVGFTPAMVGLNIVINGVTYVIGSFVTPWNVILTSSAGTQSAVSMSVTGNDPDWWTTDTWKNNVIYAAASAPLIGVGTITQNLSQCQLPGPNIVIHDSTWFNANMGSAISALPSGMLFTNPLVATIGTPANPGTYNLTLQNTSPAIAAGLVAQQPAADIRGITRNVSTEAIGAYAAASAVPVVTVSPSSVPNGELTKAYATQTFTGAGGTAPYTCSVTAGALPNGLTLGGTGNCVLSGTPTVANSFSWTITATDSTGGTPLTGSVALTATMFAAVTIPAAPPPPTTGTVGQAYSGTIAPTASTGVSPYACSLTSGSIPAGTSLVGCTISGTPTTAATYSPQITITDGLAVTANRTYTIVISAAASTPTISTSSLPNGVPNTSYSAAVLATGGTLPYTWTISVGSLPAGLTIGSSTGIISGAPTASGVTTFSVHVVDAIAGADTKSLTITVGVTAAGFSVKQ